MKVKNVLVVYYVHNYKTLQYVEKVLRKLDISFRSVRRVYVRKQFLKDRDLVIVVGGDGTFLRTSHLVDKTPVFAVTSEVNINEGFYSRSSRRDFEKKLVRIVKGRFRINKLTRLQAKINGKKVDMLAVNEIFFGSRHPYHTSRYILNVKGKREFQKSSGVLIATKHGSSGWARSAAKRKLVIPKNGFGYVVREPYIGRLTKPKILSGSFGMNGKVKVTSMMHAGIVVVDSARVFKFVDGDKLEVTVSENSLNLVEF